MGTMLSLVTTHVMPGDCKYQAPKPEKVHGGLTVKNRTCRIQTRLCHWGHTLKLQALGCPILHPLSFFGLNSVWLKRWNPKYLLNSLLCKQGAPRNQCSSYRQWFSLLFLISLATSNSKPTRRPPCFTEALPEKSQRCNNNICFP